MPRPAWWCSLWVPEGPHLPRPIPPRPVPAAAAACFAPPAGQDTPFTAGGHSPEPLAHVPQHRLLPVLLHAATKAAIDAAAAAPAAAAACRPGGGPAAGPEPAAAATPTPRGSDAGSATAGGASGGSVPRHGRPPGGSPPAPPPPSERVWWGHRLTALHQDEAGVTVTLERTPPPSLPPPHHPLGPTAHGSAHGVTAPPSPPPLRVRCHYLVAADGAHSAVRQALRVPMTGPGGPDGGGGVGGGAMQHLINAHFTSAGLGARARALLPGMLYFVFNAEVVAVLVAHSLERGEFVAQVRPLPWWSHPAGQARGSMAGQGTQQGAAGWGTVGARH